MKRIWWVLILILFLVGNAWGQENLTRPYEVILDGMISEAELYVDRTYTVITVPLEMAGITYIKTANNDKFNLSFWSFDITTPMTIYTCHDARVSGKPLWLAGWTATGETLITTDTNFEVYKKDFPVGRVDLGENTGWSMYVVAMKPIPVEEPKLGKVGLEWDANPPEQNVDGYRIYWGFETRNYSEIWDAGNNTTTVVPALPTDRKIYFAATAYRNIGRESGYSNEVWVEWDGTTPVTVGAPGNLKIIGQELQ